METIYIYIVNGSKFEDTTAWGEAWKKAVALATECHTPITREVYKGENSREEFWAGGCFLNIKALDHHAPYIF